MNNNSVKWLLSFAIFILFLALNPTMWISIIPTLDMTLKTGVIATIVLSIIMFFMTRLAIQAVLPYSEQFKGLHNVGQAYKCAEQAGINEDDKCKSCYIAAVDCLGNQSCNDETMDKCVSDESCSVENRRNTIQKCGNLSTN